jgi:hypothetical protein
MIKVDGLSLIFIDFYVPALTPRLNTSENSLQLSENITLFAVCRVYTCTRVMRKYTLIDIRCLGRIIYIYIYIFVWYNVGERTELFIPLLLYPLV